MYECVLAKFSQNLEIQEALLDTEDATLVEHTTNGTPYPFRQVSLLLLTNFSNTDRYWGDGGDGSGKNMLGKTLMRVREEIRTEKAKEKKKST